NMASDSIRKDSSRYATTYSKASFREQLTSGTLLTLTPDSGLGDVELETLTGITGFQRFPSPAALARALFLRPSEQSDFMQQSTDPVQCIDGDNFTDVHDRRTTRSAAGRRERARWPRVASARRRARADGDRACRRARLRAEARRQWRALR